MELPLCRLSCNFTRTDSGLNFAMEDKGTPNAVGGSSSPMRAKTIAWVPGELMSSMALCFAMYWRRQWRPTPVLLLGKSHGRKRSLVGFSPWGHEESATTERIHFHFSLPCIGEGNGNPLQCSCLENPRDGEAWWATVYGVAQSRTQLKWLSGSSSSSNILHFHFFIECELICSCCFLKYIYKEYVLM